MTNESEKFIPESQLKRWLAETLLGMAEQLGAKPQLSPGRREWFDTAEAAALLGYDDPRQLRQAVHSGLFRMGVEVRDKRKPNARKPRWQFHVELCHKRLKERPEKRKAL
ncbi:MAG: hypothetical protein OHK0047_44690 [Leptolyngbyaceae cyanobacterium]